MPKTSEHFVGFFILLFAMPFLLPNIGIHLSEPGWKVAETAAKKGRPQICDWIFMYPWDVLSPSSEEQRWDCRHRYAKITGDPTVCESMLPSRYGLSCVGTALGDDPCYLRTDRSVGGNGIVATLKECVNGPEEIRNNACCIVSRVNSLNSDNDCSPIPEGSKYRDQCYHELALKKLDPMHCKKIQDPKVQIGCDMQTRARKEDPSICKGCVQAIDSLEDL